MGGHSWSFQDVLKEIAAQVFIIRTGRSDPYISEKVCTIAECAGILYSPRKADKWGGSEQVKQTISTACQSLKDRGKNHGTGNRSGQGLVTPPLASLDGHLSNYALVNSAGYADAIAVLVHKTGAAHEGTHPFFVRTKRITVAGFSSKPNEFSSRSYRHLLKSVNPAECER